MAVSKIIVIPKNRDDIAKLIGSNSDILGVGEATALKILTYCETEFEITLKVAICCDKYREQIAEKFKLNPASIDAIFSMFFDDQLRTDAMCWMIDKGLTEAQANRIWSAVGDLEKIDWIIDTVPYSLIAKVPGWGFKSVDEVALKLGWKKDAPKRIEEGVKYILSNEARDGHCWTYYGDVVRLSERLLMMDSADATKRIESIIKKMIKESSINHNFVGSREQLYLPPYKDREERIVNFLVSGESKNQHRLKLISHVNTEDETFKDLNPLQEQFIYKAIDNRVVLLSGGAGTGKTYVLTELAKIYKRAGLSVIGCALAGKAAQRIQESSNDTIEAMTIHKLFGIMPKGISSATVSEVLFNHNVLIIDEFSMVNSEILDRVLSNLTRKSSVVLVGDHNQLPPIDAGCPLNDIIGIDIIPTVILKSPMRHDGNLYASCNLILNHGRVQRVRQPLKFVDTDDGRAPALDWYTVASNGDEHWVANKVRDITEMMLREIGTAAYYGYQIIVPQYKGGCGVDSLNKMAQHLFQKKFHGVTTDMSKDAKPKILMYDKIILTKNDYGMDRMNGSLGVIVPGASLGQNSDGKDISSAYVKWEGNYGIKTQQLTKQSMGNISLAYALTAHKTQGSEYSYVLFVCHRSHIFCLNKRLFYTAVTRASKTAIVVGDVWGIRTAASTSDKDERRTFIPELIKQWTDKNLKNEPELSSEMPLTESEPCGVLN